MKFIQLNHPFNRCGLASLSDLNTPEWKELFKLLEKEQESFLQKENLFRSPEYKWPRDPLHTWSRVWEYPYVYHHLKEARKRYRGNGLPIVVDFGSGVTFFPFAIAKLGYHVICVDNDPTCERDMKRAIEIVLHNPGKVEFRLNKSLEIPFQDKEVDIIYSISVLEHISNFARVIMEMARILKPGGLLLLTIDLDLRGDHRMGIREFYLLKREILKYFELMSPEETVHPADILTSDKGPYGFKNPVGFKLLKFLIKQRIIKPLLGLKPAPMIPFHLAVMGMVMREK